MKSTIIATAFIALSTSLFAAPAIAGPVKANIEIGKTINATEIGYKNRNRGYGERRHQTRFLSTRQISRALRHQGYGNIQDIRRYRSTYRVVAFSHRGPYKLTVSAKNGQILDRQRLSQRRHYGQRYNPGITFGGNRGGWSWSYTVR